MKMKFLTLRGLKKLIDGVEKYVDQMYEIVDTLTDNCKKNNDDLTVRISDLEQRLKVVECERTGHEYTKWERDKFIAWGKVYVVGTCQCCGRTVKKLPERMKPAEKKRFIDLGILFEEDFSVKKKGKDGHNKKGS